MNASVLLAVAALVLFILAAVIAGGWVTAGVSASCLAYFGLAALSASFLVN